MFSKHRPGRYLLAPWLPAGLLVAALSVLVALSAGGCRQQPTVDRTGLGQISHPDLGALPSSEARAEAQAKEALEGQRQRLEELLADPGSTAADLAHGFGRMAQLYDAYGLPAPARTAYANARLLAPRDGRWPFLLALLEQEAGDLDAAQEYLDATLALAPDDRAAHMTIGEVQLSRGDFDDADAAFEAAAELGPAAVALAGEGSASEDPFAAAIAYGRGRAAAGSGDPVAAVRHFQQALELDPEAGAVRYPLAQALRKLGRGDEAQALLALGSGPAPSYPEPRRDEVEALAQGAAALMKKAGQAMVNNRLEEAVDLYRQAVTADAENVEAKRNLALALTRSGQGREAVDVLERALARAPEDGSLYLDLGNAHLAASDQTAAVRAFEDALERSPDLVSARFNLANVLMLERRWIEAEGHLRRILELDPNHQRARYQLAVGLYESGAKDQGLKALRKLVREEPDMEAARLSLAAILAESGDLRGAIRHYRILDQGSDDPKTQAAAVTGLASLSLRQRRTPQAKAQLERALRIDPTLVEAHNNLASLLQQEGRTEEALNHYHRVVKLQPDDGDARQREATALILLGRYQEAKTRLEEGATRLSSHVGLTHTLARLLATSPDGDVRDGPRALAIARQVYLGQRTLEHAQTVGMALAEAGQMEEAVRWQRQLVVQARNLGQPQVVAALEKNLALYDRGESVRIGQ